MRRITIGSTQLVHMQGRVYDPVLGRFLSADPYIQAPHNTQSYNRYSYVFNNPLSFTDPSGYQATNVNGPSPGAPSEEAEEEIVITSQPPNSIQQYHDTLANLNTSWYVNSVHNYTWAYVGNLAYNMSTIQGQILYGLATWGPPTVQQKKDWDMNNTWLNSSWVHRNAMSMNDPEMDGALYANKVANEDFQKKVALSVSAPIVVAGAIEVGASLTASQWYTLLRVVLDSDDASGASLTAVRRVPPELRPQVEHMRDVKSFPK